MVVLIALAVSAVVVWLVMQIPSHRVPSIGNWGALGFILLCIYAAIAAVAYMVRG
jgi:hypothetical protein